MERQVAVRKAPAGTSRQILMSKYFSFEKFDFQMFHVRKEWFSNTLF